MPPIAPRIVEWHRADVWPRMRRVLLTGPAILTLGGLVVAGAFLAHQPRAVVADATVGGLLLVAAGALSTAIGMQRILRDDVYLALRTDGIHVKVAGVDALVLWDTLEEVRWDADRRELVLERTGAPAIAIAGSFARIDGPALARRVASIKRKAAMNLLG